MPRPTFAQTEPTWDVPDDDRDAAHRMTVCSPWNSSHPLIALLETSSKASC
jgi:hypothetical protein